MDALCDVQSEIWLLDVIALWWVMLWICFNVRNVDGEINDIHRLVSVINIKMPNMLALNFCSSLMFFSESRCVQFLILYEAFFSYWNVHFKLKKSYLQLMKEVHACFGWSMDNFVAWDNSSGLFGLKPFSMENIWAQGALIDLIGTVNFAITIACRSCIYLIFMCYIFCIFW